MKSRQSYVLLTFFLFSSFVLFGQTVEDYQRGYRNGFKDGFCKNIPQCTSPYLLTSNIPSPGVNERNYQAGYARGNTDGSKRKITDKNSKNESESRPCSEGIVIEKLIQRVYESEYDEDTGGTGGSFENKRYSSKVTIDMSLGSYKNSILFNVKIKDMEVCLDQNNTILLSFRDGSKREVKPGSDYCDGETILFLGNIFGKQSLNLLEDLNKKELEYIRISNDLFSFEYDDISSTEVYLSKFESLQILYTINCLSSNLN